MKVLNFGSLNIDRVYTVDTFVQPGETKSVDSYNEVAGGKGLNQSVALARAGARVEHVGFIGKDGELLANALKESGATLKLKTVESASGNAIIEVERSGENRILVAPGANHSFDRKTILEHLDTKPCWILLQNEINESEFIINAAKDRGHRVCQNIAPITDQAKRYPIERLNMLILNEGEAIGLSNGQRLETAIDALVSRCPETELILTLGEKGAIAIKAGEKFESPAFEVDPVDTTAAGDSFVGYYLSKRIADTSINESLRFACAAAAIAVQHPGASPSIPYHSEVDAFLSER